MGIRLFDRKDEIRDALVAAAQEGAPFPSYEKFGEHIGIWRMRGAKDVLDWIAEEERQAGRPDVTFILHSATTGYPSQIGGSPAKPPSTEQKRIAAAEMRKVIKRYCPGISNPYGSEVA